MALINLGYCLGPTEFVCPANLVEVSFEVELSMSTKIILQKLLFLHPMGIDAPLDATVRRVLKQHRMLPGSAPRTRIHSIRFGVQEMIVQPLEGDPVDSGGIPVETFSGVGNATDSVLAGFAAMNGERLGFTLRNHSDRDSRVRFAVLVRPIVSAPVVGPVEGTP